MTTAISAAVPEGLSGLVDSHCHLDLIDLAPYEGSFARMLETNLEAGLSHLLWIGIDMEKIESILRQVVIYPQTAATVGVHPSYSGTREPSVSDLFGLAGEPGVVGIGETGLDYFHEEVPPAKQRARFQRHVEAARDRGLPLVIHTREAQDDTLAILREASADGVGGVLHCFTESLAMAEAAMEMGFYISFSGIVTFRNAASLRAVAQKIPVERLLIETDSPWLAPVPFRGKPNEPRHVVHVAQCIAEVREQPVTEIISQTRDNYLRLFGPDAATTHQTVTV